MVKKDQLMGEQMKNRIKIELYSEFVEYLYDKKNGDYLGKIIFDGEDYHFKISYWCNLSKHKGYMLKEIAERLIKLNYPKKNR